MTTSPGWHPAPDRPGQLRYWDGEAWTDQYAAAQSPPPLVPQKKSRGKLLAVVAAVLVIGGCAALIGGEDSGGDGDSSTSDSSDDDEPDAPDPDDPDLIGDEIGAQVVCEDFVEDRLKAPSTADFGDEEVSHIRGPVWEVAGEVDAENGFGAMIRNDYVCRVKFTGDDRWTLVKLTGLDA